MSYSVNTAKHTTQPCAIKDNTLSWSIPWIVTGCFLVLLGSAIRIWLYSSALPLRIDEIRLALNIIDRSYIGLLEPLDHKQGAPLAFLFASKLIVGLVGANALTYRILPMLCGIAGLCVFGLTARRHLHPVGVIFALAVVSLSPHLIQRAADFKQYSSDFLMTSAMLLVALPWLNGYRTLGCWVALTCVGSLCLLISHPGVFYVAAVGLVWLIDLIATSKKEGLIKVCGDVGNLAARPFAGVLV